MATHTAPPHPAANTIASDAEAIDVARAFAASIAPGASERDRTRRLPRPELDELRRSGLLATTVPRTAGGADVSATTLAEIFRTISAADPSIGQLPQNHFATVDIIRLDGTPDQQAFFFGLLLNGAAFGNATSERGTKDVFRDIRTRLSKSADGGLRLNGRKYYSTGALFADWIPVFALNDDDRLVVPIVERNAPGVEVIDDWSGMGQRTTASGSAVFTDVPVAPELVIEHGDTYDAPTDFGAYLQLMHVAIDVGIADAALADALDYVRERSRPWFESELDRASDDPHTMYRFGQLIVAQRAATALLERAARTIDDVRAVPLTSDSAAAASLAVAEAKAAATASVLDVTNDLFALAGTSSADDAHNLHRHWRNARTHTLHDPVRWKYHHIGNHALNGVLPPRSGWL
jgi:SfnB family sulfur acquisition oxidoreductase